jgi:hypothetical protein
MSRQVLPVLLALRGQQATKAIPALKAIQAIKAKPANQVTALR